MRKLFGFLMLTAGLAFGAFAFFPEAVDREARLIELTTIIAAPAGEVTRSTPESTGSIRTFAPAQPMTIREAPSPAPAETVIAKTPATPVAAAPAAPEPTPSLAPPQSSGWQAVVTAEQGAVPTGVTSSKPGDGHARYELVMSLQRELKRAGCYGGTLTGSWSAVTKRAMSAFMERVNSTLPIDEPDYILLTLLKGNANATCVSCPMGQTMSDGRCVPKAIIAQTARKTNKTDVAAAKPADSGFTTIISVAEAETSSGPTPQTLQTAPLPGRMAIGGPASETPSEPPAAAPWSIKVLTTPATPSVSVVQQAPPAPAAAPPVSTPAAPALQSPPVKITPAKTKTAALIADDDDQQLLDSPAAQSAPTDPAPLPAVAPAPASRQNTAPAPSVQPPQSTWPGLPGTKSGRTLPTYTYAPPPRAEPPQRPEHVARPPRPQRAQRPSRPRVAAQRPQRTNGNRGTRSVQSLFQHPLGRL